MFRRQELARFLGISDRQLQRLRERGELPRPILISERVLCWRRRDIDAWLLSREVAGR